MKVTKITTYECEHCHKTFVGADECLAHEERCRAGQFETAKKLVSKMQKLMGEAEQAGLKFRALTEEPAYVIYDESENKLLFMPF